MGGWVGKEGNLQSQAVELQSWAPTASPRSMFSAPSDLAVCRLTPLRLQPRVSLRCVLVNTRAKPAQPEPGELREEKKICSQNRRGGQLQCDHAACDGDKKRNSERLWQKKLPIRELNPGLTRDRGVY